MEKITFCINTSKNERPYIELLLQSLLNGVDVDLHDVLIFVDSDNQDTTKMLIDQHSVFPNLTIIKNKGTPIGYQKNINFMFNYAKTDIVSYLQSDMIVSLDYDKAILSHLTPNMILSATRVEPPLHSQFDTGVNWVKNFGFIPEEFDYTGFLMYAEQIKDKNKLINFFFAPFTLYKHLWNDIGGHDVQFVKSREDSDVLMRFCLKKYDIKQCWDAVVYHFSCISSRGIDWWKQEHMDKEQIRRQNDAIELDRFIKKWGRFIHPTSYNDIAVDVAKNPSLLDKIVCVNPPLEFDFEIL